MAHMNFSVWEESAFSGHPRVHTDILMPISDFQMIWITGSLKDPKKIISAWLQKFISLAIILFDKKSYFWRLRIQKSGWSKYCISFQHFSILFYHGLFRVQSSSKHNCCCNLGAIKPYGFKFFSTFWVNFGLILKV